MAITYHYYCFQWEGLTKQAKKHLDSQKHRDRQPINHYICKGYIKITIYEDFVSSDIETTKPNVLISPEIKQFI